MILGMQATDRRRAIRRCGAVRQVVTSGRTITLTTIALLPPGLAEEIFGPRLPTVRYDDLDKLITNIYT